MGVTDATLSTESNQHGLPGNAGTLNVILHGLFIIVVGDEITVYIPNMGTDHAYRAGNWLAETTLADGDYRLEGAMTEPRQPDTYPFDVQKNIVLKNVHVADANCCDRTYATLHLPFTSSVRSLGRLPIPKDGIGGDSTDKIAPGSGSYNATVQILTYKFSSDSNLRLGQHPWEPALDGGFVNLHIFSEPDQTPEDDHVRHAFQMSMGLFAGVDLSMKRPFAPANLEKEIANHEIPQGVHPLEAQSLLMRLKWLAVLGRAIKDNRDLNGSWEFPSAFGDDGSCTGGGLDQGNG